MSTCTCGHPKYGHSMLCPAATERATSMTGKIPPYTIDPADVEVGDLIEVTSTAHPDSKIIDRVKERSGTAIRCQWSYWTTDRSDGETFRLLDRPEPPKPAPPTTVGTVIAGMHDNRPFVAVTWSEQGTVRGAYTDGRNRALADFGPEEDFDWTVVYDPTAPKTDDDGLRERVEKLIEVLTRNGRYHASAGNDYQRGKGAGLLHAVEDLLHLLGSDETSADA